MSNNATVIAGTQSHIGNTAQIAVSGANFDARVRPYAGGDIGLLTCGDSVAFDNVKLYAIGVDAPASVSLVLLGLALAGLGRARRRPAVALRSGWPWRLLLLRWSAQKANTCDDK
jgi:hypothetical protein